MKLGGGLGGGTISVLFGDSHKRWGGWRVEALNVFFLLQKKL